MKKFYINSFMQDVTAFGTLYHLVFLIAVLLSFGRYDIAYKLVAGQAAMYAISVPIKLLLFKSRPKKMLHKNIIEKIEASSFPSVHTIRTFFVSFVLASFFKNTAITIILLVLSLLVAYSRIYLKRHYFSDIFVGAIIGIALGYGVMNYV